jgi:RNA polymerase sigma-70 factor, ECF subfamily
LLPLLLLLLARALEDERLVRQYRKGDVGALENLYARYRSPLLSFLTRLMGDAAEAEDAFVETWAKVAAALPQYEAKGRFRSFLFTVARREALHILQKRANRDSRQALTAEGTEMDRVTDGGHGDPEQGAERARLAQRLQAELDSLSEELRACFLLYHAEGLTVPEVAAATSLSPATVKRRIARAREVLAARLMPYRDEEDDVAGS